MTFDWTLFVHIGIISAALMVSTFIRTRIRFFQRFLIPNALTAGFILLPLYNFVFPALGLDSMTLEALTYHLLSVSFVAMSLRKAPKRPNDGRIFATSVAVLSQYAIQTTVGLLLTFLLISTIMPELFHSFGWLMPLGFVLGPRINAAGRVGTADLGARLLATDDPSEAEALAQRLDALNRERREVEAAVLDAATRQAEARGADGPLVWAAAEGWHKGVVGIVAARLKEAFGRPAVVIGLEGAEGTGSGRSVDGVDLGAAVATAAREGLLLKGGGHRMAAGLTVATDRLEPAMERLGELLARQGAGAGGPRDLRLDGAMAPGGATPELCEMLEAAGPFGQSAPAPRFALAGVRVAFAKPMGEGHLRLSLDGAGGRCDAVAFRVGGTPLGECLGASAGAALHVAGRLEIDDWGGRRRARLRVEDAAAAT